MLEMFNPEIKFAIEATRQAGLLVRSVQAELVNNPAVNAQLKADLSPVTVADFAAQALVGRMLSETFPDDPVVAEEDSAVLRQPENAATLESVTRFVKEWKNNSDAQAVCGWIDHNRADSGRRFWTLDPIDGTKGFLRGDQYAVALALVVDGNVQVGALACPNLSDGYRPNLEGNGSLVVAARGQGTWITDMAYPGTYERLNVSSRSQAEQARILRSFESGHTNVDQIDEFARALKTQASPLRMDSQAKYAVLASGKGDLILRLLSPSKPDYKEKIWDQAAGSLVLEEAGGRISDLHGTRLDFTMGRTLQNNRGVLASNGALHEAALRALEEIGA